jgi:hypothetical protein
MACLYFFGSATSVCRYDYGNSELNFAISWLRGLAKIVKSQVLRRYQMRIKGLRSRAAPRNLARSFSQRTPICSDRVSTLSDSNLQTTRPADPRPQMFEIDPTCSIRKNEARKTAPGDRWREQRFGDAPIAAELVRPRIIKDRTARAWLRAHSGRAEWAAPLDSCSQSSAKFVILVPEASHSLYAAFFKDNSIPHGAAPPTIHDTVTRSFEPSTRGRARCVTLNV